MLSGENPAASNRSMNGHSCWWNHGSTRVLPLPTHGSTSVRRPGSSITRACTRRAMRPCSSAKSGTSQPCPATAAAVAAGKKNSGGISPVWFSTTLVIVVAPIFQVWVAVGAAIGPLPSIGLARRDLRTLVLLVAGSAGGNARGGDVRHAWSGRGGRAHITPAG
jgi:hypothetical protein